VGATVAIAGLGGEAQAVLRAAQNPDVIRRAGRGRPGAVFVPGGRGIKTARLAVERCPVEAAFMNGRLKVRTPLGIYAVEPTPSALLSLAEKLSAACGEDRHRLYDRLKEAAMGAAGSAGGLEKWLAGM
jgi:hypothetical protein